MRDVFYLDSLGKDVSPFAPRVNMLGKQNFLNICLPIYYTGESLEPSTLKDGYLYPYLAKGCLGILCLGFLFKSRFRSLRNLRCAFISE